MDQLIAAAELAELSTNITNNNDNSSLFSDLLLNATSIVSNNTNRSRTLTRRIKISHNVSMAFKVLNWLNTYYLGLIIIVGILGNLKNVVVFLLTNKSKLRSPNYYLASLALADVIFLAVLLILWISQFGVDLFFRPGIYQMFYYLSSASSCISGNQRFANFIIIQI